MKACGMKNERLDLARICYRYTIGITRLFFLKLGFMFSVLLTAIEYSVMLRTKFWLSSLDFRKLFLTFLASIMIAGLASPPLCAKNTQMPLLADNARILFIQGDVLIKAEVASKWTEATSGMILLKGDTLKIGPKSWVRLDIDTHKNHCTVGENTSINIVDLDPVKIKTR